MTRFSWSGKRTSFVAERETDVTNVLRFALTTVRCCLDNHAAVSVKEPERRDSECHRERGARKLVLIFSG